MTQTLESIITINDVKNLTTEKLCNLLKYSKHPKLITEALQKERAKRVEAQKKFSQINNESDFKKALKEWALKQKGRG